LPAGAARTHGASGALVHAIAQRAQVYAPKSGRTSLQSFPALAIFSDGRRSTCSSRELGLRGE
jgi:hypothetical protein